MIVTRSLLIIAFSFPSNNPFRTLLFVTNSALLRASSNVP